MGFCGVFLLRYFPVKLGQPPLQDPVQKGQQECKGKSGAGSVSDSSCHLLGVTPDCTLWGLRMFVYIIGKSETILRKRVKIGDK